MSWRAVAVTTSTLTIIAAAPARSQGVDEWTPFLGEWTGVATRRPDAGLPVTLRVSVRREGDSARVTLTLPESRQIELTVPSPYSDSATATVRSDTLRVELTPDIGLGFIGRLGVPHDDERVVFTSVLRGDRMLGRLRITTYESPIELRRTPDRTELREPQVTFHSTQDSLRLGGTLVLPRGRGPFPAMVWVTGSDPDTREAWMYEARMLAARGVASLVYDKRGVGESAGASHDLASWDDLAGDVEGALRYLRSRPDLIDSTRLGLAGQSQGTWIIAKVAARDPAVRFVVSISGSGISAAEQETYRTGALMRADGFSEHEVARAQDFQRRKFAVARTGLGWSALDSAMQQLRADSVRWFPGYGTGAAARSLALLRLFGVLQFNYDPTRDLESLRSPVLIVMGEGDLVFPPAIVIDRMRRALERAGNHDVTARIVPGASHGLMTVQQASGHPFRRAISGEFLAILAEWVPRHAGVKP
jgi:pimeloyl-ACP methyl ester carboxylesterase